MITIRDKYTVRVVAGGRALATKEMTGTRAECLAFLNAVVERATADRQVVRAVKLEGSPLTWEVNVGFFTYICTVSDVQNFDQYRDCEMLYTGKVR